MPIYAKRELLLHADSQIEMSFSILVEHQLVSKRLSPKQYKINQTDVFV